MKAFTKSKWIWPHGAEGADLYAEFHLPPIYKRGCALMRLSCDSDYALFINGKYAASNQYGDFEHYKIYDELDITEWLTEGENSITAVVHHCGIPTSRYRPASAGFIYEVILDGHPAAYSNEKTLSRVSPYYKSGLLRSVSPQLGLTFAYDSVGKERELNPSVRVEKACRLFPRPIKKAKLLPLREGRIVSNEANRYLVDLGGETVGLPSLKLVSPVRQNMTVAWGEVTVGGHVRRTVGKRSFYFEYECKEGLNLFTEYMLRVGCRYLEISAEEPFELISLGVYPQVVEVEALPYSAENELDAKIYEICLNTLRLCMMEHYVDCPWREQALYAFDSRNQMLSGYYAFKDGNADYARANLLLINEDRRSDGLLSICYPCGNDRAIPSFSLHYVTAVREYLFHTGDTVTALRILPKLRSILNEFSSHREGLITSPEGENIWNFYDWSEYLDGHIESPGVKEKDLVLNCLFILALDSFRAICEMTGENYGYGSLADELRPRVREYFSDRSGLLTHRRGEREYTALGNSLAILSGVVTGNEAELIAEAVALGKAAEPSLSMRCFKYDCLLMTDEEKYAPLVLEEIRRSYKIMLDAGSDTVWETLDGAKAFDNAGSLCHGWSAIPIYYLRRLRAIS